MELLRFIAGNFRLGERHVIWGSFPLGSLLLECLRSFMELVWYAGPFGVHARLGKRSLVKVSIDRPL